MVIPFCFSIIKYNIRYLSFAISILLPYICLGQGAYNSDSYSYGLAFKSHEVNKDERTSLNLTPVKNALDTDFTLEFDLKLIDVWDSYGYVFRIVANDSTSIDMTSFLREQKLNFIINNTQKNKHISEFKILEDFPRKDWIHIVFKKEKSLVKYSVAGKETILSEDLTDFSVDKIFFGANKYKSFFTSDVPPMVVKNILIKNQYGDIVRNWRLDKHGDNFVKDNVGGYLAVVENPIWEIDYHVKWKEVQSLILTRTYPQIATDSIGGRVFVAIPDSLYIIDVKYQLVKRLKVNKGNSFRGPSSYLIYDYKRDRLISYNVNQPRLLTYDFETNSWSGDPDNNYQHIQHHNRMIDPNSNQLIVFGGYGNYTYKSEWLTHNLDDGNWTKASFIDDIAPRYLAASGYLGDNKMLVFGGYGCQSGIQEVGARNYYDIWQIDLTDHKRQRLGEIEWPDSHYTFSNSMIIDQPDNKFYALSYRNDEYRTSLKLFAVSLKDMSYYVYEDSIPYNFHDTESFCDLFLHQKNTLYAVVSQKIDDRRYQVSIHSLLFPPLSQADVLQSENTDYEIETIIIGLLFVGLAVGAIFFVYHYYHKKSKMSLATDNSLLQNITLGIPQNEELQVDKTRLSSVLLLGNFEIFDKEGNDMLWHFSPITKQILLFCLLESVTTGKGVTSDDLDNEFWPDMDKSKATNNRNVNIRKLRLLLQEIGNVTLVRDKNYWRIEVGAGSFCDYQEIMVLLNKVKYTSHIDKKTIEEIISLGLAGALLPNVDFGWVDKYKAEYSSLLIDTLMSATGSIDIKSDLKLLVNLSEVILLHDNIDEDAIQIKCRSLYLLGQKGLSKQTYNRYCSDYKLILNEDPNLRYEDIIKI